MRWGGVGKSEMMLAMASQTSLVSEVSKFSKVAANESDEQVPSKLTAWQEKQTKQKISMLLEENADLTVDLSMTIGICGVDGVGKRSLVSKVCGEKASRTRPNLKPKEITFKNKIYSIDGLIIYVQFWTAPGDNSYISRSSRFLSKTAGNIVLYDVSNPDTLSNAREWIQELDKRTGKDATGTDGKIKRIPTLLVGNKIDVGPLVRKVPYSAGSDLAYAFGIDYYESTCIEEIRDDALTKEMEELDLMESKTKDSVDMRSDKVDESGDPDLVVINLVRKVLRQLPKARIDLTNLPEDCNSDSLALLAVPAQIYVSTNIRLHRPLYTTLPIGFIDLNLDETIDEKAKTVAMDKKLEVQAPIVTRSAIAKDIGIDDKLLGDYLVGIDDDQGFNILQGDFGGEFDAELAEKRRLRGTQRIRQYESRIQYNTCLERLNPLHTLASEKLDWL